MQNVIHFAIFNIQISSFTSSRAPFQGSCQRLLFQKTDVANIQQQLRLTFYEVSMAGFLPVQYVVGIRPAPPWLLLRLLRLLRLFLRLLLFRLLLLPPLFECFECFLDLLLPPKRDFLLLRLLRLLRFRLRCLGFRLFFFRYSVRLNIDRICN